MERKAFPIFREGFSVLQAFKPDVKDYGQSESIPKSFAGADRPVYYTGKSCPHVPALGINTDGMLMNLFNGDETLFKTVVNSYTGDRRDCRLNVKTEKRSLNVPE